MEQRSKDIIERLIQDLARVMAKWVKADHHTSDVLKAEFHNYMQDRLDISYDLSDDLDKILSYCHSELSYLKEFAIALETVAYSQGYSDDSDYDYKLLQKLLIYIDEHDDVYDISRLEKINNLSALVH